jgi:hypothetical protein
VTCFGVNFFLKKLSAGSPPNTFKMQIPVYSTKWDKINLVTTFLMSGPPCGWLFLIGSGGDGKSMATNEAITLWRRSLGEDIEDPISDIVYLPSYVDGAGHKIVLMKKGEIPVVKTIVHVLGWSQEWHFMATEWGASIARFERGNEA